MGVVAGLYVYDVVVKSSRSLSHLLMSSCSLCYQIANGEENFRSHWQPIYVAELMIDNV